MDHADVWTVKTALKLTIETLTGSFCPPFWSLPKCSLFATQPTIHIPIRFINLNPIPMYKLDVSIHHCTNWLESNWMVKSPSPPICYGIHNAQPCVCVCNFNNIISSIFNVCWYPNIYVYIYICYLFITITIIIIVMLPKHMWCNDAKPNTTFDNPI